MVIEWVVKTNDDLTETRTQNNILKDILESHFCIISTPDYFHNKYLKLLLEHNYKGYIFCEKSPIAREHDLEELSRSINNKVFFNFPLRFAENFLESIDIDLGKLLNLSIVWGHGLATTSNYQSSWRNSINLSPLGTLTHLAIHFIDFAINNFGESKNISFLNFNLRDNNQSPETTYVTINHDNNFQTNIFCSYMMPFYEEISLISENYVIKLAQNQLSIIGPRDTFDSNGLFARQCFTSIKKDFDIFSTALEKSINFFIKHVKEKLPIPELHNSEVVYLLKKIFENPNDSL
jgi:predicted dehydrogenase